MQIEQVINWGKAHPALVGAIGGYVFLGIIVLWAICRSGERFSFASLPKGLLTLVFAVPIWPVVWIVWILHFRSYAPAAVDLTNFRLPEVDLTSFRADDVRFAPQKKGMGVVEAEIVHDPQVPGASQRPTIKPSAPPPKGVRPGQKPRAITKRVSAISPGKKKLQSASPEAKTEKLKPGSVPSPKIEKSTAKPKATTPEISDSDKPVNPTIESPPPPPTISKKAPPPKPPKPSKPRPNTSSIPPQKAPQWKKLSVETRKPEPPSAPPYVQKMSPEKEKAPPPFPNPAKATPIPLKSSGGDPKTISDTNNPDVPEIPLS